MVIFIVEIARGRKTECKITIISRGERLRGTRGVSVAHMQFHAHHREFHDNNGNTDTERGCSCSADNVFFN